MAVGTYTPSSTKIVHWTGVDFVSRPTMFPPIHLVQYDQKLPVIAVNLYNNGEIYAIPSNVNANILVEKIDGTFVSNPVLGCNADRTVLYFEATYQMLYYSGIIKPVLELKMSDTEYGSSSAITIIVDRNPVQESAKESSNEYKSVEQFMNQAISAKNTAVSAANSASQSKTEAAQSAANAAKSEQNARDYAMSGVELMASLKSSNSVQERLTDSNGEAVLDSNGNEVMGAIQFATNNDLINIRNQSSISLNRINSLNEQNNKQTLQIMNLEEQLFVLLNRIETLDEQIKQTIDYAMSGVELMASLKSSNSVQERLTDSNGEAVLDSNGNEVMGAIQFATNNDLINIRNQSSISLNRINSLNEQNNKQTLQIMNLEEHAILDS